MPRFLGKVIIFWDDNLASDREYAKALFRSIAPYRKWWSSQVSIQAGKDAEFLEWAAKSGCKQLSIGYGIYLTTKHGWGPQVFNRVEEYVRVIEHIHEHGIAVQAASRSESTKTPNYLQ